MGLCKNNPVEFRGAGTASLAAVLACGWSLGARFDPPPSPGVEVQVRSVREAEHEASESLADAPGPRESSADERRPSWDEAAESPGWTVEAKFDADFDAESPELEVERFVWPEPPADDPGAPLPGLLEEPLFTHGFLAHVLEATASSPALDFMNDLLSGPELMFDTGADLMLRWIPRPDPVLRTGDDRPVVFRMLDLRVGPGQGPLFSSFLNSWLLRERNFFAGLAEWGMDGIAYGEGVGEIDEDYLMSKQRKLLWDTLRRSYLAKFQLEGRETVRKDGFGFAEWKTIDYVVVPPIAAAYVYFRGFDQRITAGDVRLSVGLEPVSEWIGFKSDFVGGLTVEVMLKGFPVGLVAAFGVSDGDLCVDFIGIGTGIDVALKALARRQEAPPYADFHR